jgi:hypothetical protein
MLKAAGKKGVPQGGVSTPLTQKGNFSFDRVICDWRTRVAVLDLRLKK